MKTIYQKSEDMPKSIISRKLYYQLGDIYITKSMGIEAINSVVERIGKYMSKEVVIH
jgi:hypothetical protein